MIYLVCLRMIYFLSLFWFLLLWLAGSRFRRHLLQRLHMKTDWVTAMQLVSFQRLLQMQRTTSSFHPRQKTLKQANPSQANLSKGLLHCVDNIFFKEIMLLASDGTKTSYSLNVCIRVYDTNVKNKQNKGHYVLLGDSGKAWTSWWRKSQKSSVDQTSHFWFRPSWSTWPMKAASFVGHVDRVL